MQDPFFKRSVVLLTDHTPADGAVGFILNKPINMQINDVVADFPEIDAPLYFGGPVARETLHYIHDAGDIVDDSHKIVPGIFWGGDFEKLKFLISSKLIMPKNIRFFLGYSGWSAGQLNDEMEYGSWVLSEADANYAFNTSPSKMWSRVMKNKGGNFGVIGEMPDSAMLN